MKEIDVQTLKKMQDDKQDFQLIDVREPNEFAFANLGGELIPLGTVMQNADKISRNKPVIVHCRSGKRSADAIRQLETLGFDNLHNLKGGYLAYAQEINPELPLY
jgi:rhodanese-related sulfurtransferase